MMSFSFGKAKAQTHHLAIEMSERIIAFAKECNTECAKQEAHKLLLMAGDCEDLAKRVKEVHVNTLRYVGAVCDHIDMEEFDAEV